LLLNVYQDTYSKLRKLSTVNTRSYYCCCSIGLYTVTKPYEVFRHSDRMAPELMVRGRENISPVRPG